jgi:cell division protein FtsZ
VRVTVVATGLGHPVTAARPQPVGGFRQTEAAGRAELPTREREMREPPMRVVRRSPLSSSDYAQLDKPTVQRQRAVGDGLRQDTPADDLLDIPAFLRRQAD